MKKFTLIEFLVVLAICLILAGMLAPAIIQVKQRSGYETFKKVSKESVTIIGGEPLLSLNEFVILKKSFSTSDELRKIIDREMDIKNTTIPLLQERLMQRTKIEDSVVLAQGELYSQWSAFTGNPQNLTKQQFEVLKEQNLIKELEYYAWKTITGNAQGLTEEQFNALKAKDAISFPVKKTVTSTQEKW